MADHDQRFKVLLQEFFREFLVLFFPRWAERFDFDHLEWLTQEAFTDPPQGARRYLDLVAKLPTREVVPAQRSVESDSLLALIHVEIEQADTVQPLRSRMHEYVGFLRHKHQLPVLPIALYLRVGLEGVGIDVYEEFFWEFQIITFRYLYVGLPALSAEQFVHGDNWLGVALAALMDIAPERRAWLTAEALNRLVDSPLTEYRRHLLCECVQAYAPLDEEQWRQLEQLLVTDPYQRLRPMTTTWLEQTLEKRESQGREQGRREGIPLGQRQLLLDMIEARFGTLSEGARARLDAWPEDRLTELGRTLLTVKTLQELGLEG